MDKIKLNVLTLVVCSGMAGYTIADEVGDTHNQAGAQANTLQANQPNNEVMNAQGNDTMTARPSNATLTSDVNAALADYSGKVEVKVKNGIVYLSGELPSDTDYEKVITLSKSTKGVSDVNADELTVKDSNAPLYDTYITAKVRGSLIQADLMGKDVPNWSVSIETKDGKVFLSGSVASEAEKQKVESIAKSVEGVKSIDNQLKIDETSSANDSNTMPNDQNMDDDANDTASDNS